MSTWITVYFLDQRTQELFFDSFDSFNSLPAMPTKAQRKEEQRIIYAQWEATLRAIAKESHFVDDQGTSRCCLCKKAFNTNVSAEEAFASHRANCWSYIEKEFLKLFSEEVEEKGQNWKCIKCDRCVDLFSSDPHAVWKAHCETPAHSWCLAKDKKLTEPVTFIKKTETDPVVDEETTYGLGVRMLLGCTVADRVRKEQLKGRDAADVEQAEQSRANTLAERMPDESWRRKGIGYEDKKRPMTLIARARDRSTCSDRRRSRNYDRSQSRRPRKNDRSRSRRPRKDDRSRSRRPRKDEYSHSSTGSSRGASKLYEIEEKFILLQKLLDAGHISSYDYSQKKKSIMASI
jgi:hypothetical protein